MSDRYTVERIMEIIAYVIGVGSKGTPLAKVDMGELHRLGYTDSEISAALSWILEKAQDTSGKNERGTQGQGDAGSFRILHGIEAETITPEGWGLLLSYVNLGFLTNDDVEQIIERAMMMANETIVDVPEVRTLVAVYVMHRGPLPLSGSRSLLSGTDSIN
jgi:uncharacterized protein Smg (DUF494 family)